ncbi:MAG: hypothetical protein LC789_16615 [Actinobacteria bacterium]|nr:hypothetical protein [Actinomycetota bacterium]MCA1720877.1 hypothetical protein [Actinomycetota bacterium]
MRRTLVALVIAPLLLVGCSAGRSPEAELQAGVNDLVSAANAKDPAAVRTAGSRLLATINAQKNNGDIPLSKAKALQTLTSRVMANANSLEPAASPVPVAPSAAPSPVRESPEPSPEPSPTEEPKKSPRPSPTEAPPSPVVEVSLQPSPLAS